MSCVQQGNHQCFTILVERHTKMFYSASYRICQNRDMAEDVVQDSFVKLWHKPTLWHSNKKAKFTTWFYRIVVNQSIDAMRKNKKTRHINEYDHVIATTQVQQQDQQSAMEDMEQQQWLENAIQSLPERQKIALNLCIYEDISQKEAAHIMSISVKALESLLSRAKATLKTMREKG